MSQKNRQNKTNEKKTKILIVDDHPIVRQGIAELINREADIMVCGQAEDISEAMETIKTSKPDIVIVPQLIPKYSER